MSNQLPTDAEVIASLGIGGNFISRKRPRKKVFAASKPMHTIRWTDSDNLHGRDARVVGGVYDGMLISVRQQGNRYRYPDVLDLSRYVFDPESWTFQENAS